MIHLFKTIRKLLGLFLLINESKYLAFSPVLLIF